MFTFSSLIKILSSLITLVARCLSLHLTNAVMKCSTRTTATRISDITWEEHKDAIERLFLTERIPLKGKIGYAAIELMEKNHSFRAT